MRIHHTLLRPHGLGAESDWEQLGGEMRALAETKLKQDALLIEHEARSRVSAQLMRQQAIAEQSLQIRENAQGMREAVVVSGEEEKPEPYSMYLHRIYDELTQNELRATQNPFARAQLRKRFLSYGETLLHHGLEQERLALQRDTERRLSSLFQSAAHRVRFENVAETKKQMQSLIQNSDLPFQKKTRLMEQVPRFFSRVVLSQLSEHEPVRFLELVSGYQNNHQHRDVFEGTEPEELTRFVRRAKTNQDRQLKQEQIGLEAHQKNALSLLEHEGVEDNDYFDRLRTNYREQGNAARINALNEKIERARLTHHFLVQTDGVTLAEQEVKLTALKPKKTEEHYAFARDVYEAVRADFFKRKEVYLQDPAKAAEEELSQTAMEEKEEKQEKQEKAEGLNRYERRLVHQQLRGVLIYLIIR